MKGMMLEEKAWPGPSVPNCTNPRDCGLRRDGGKISRGTLMRDSVRDGWFYASEINVLEDPAG